MQSCVELKPVMGVCGIKMFLHFTWIGTFLQLDALATTKLIVSSIMSILFPQHQRLFIVVLLNRDKSPDPMVWSLVEEH